MALDSMNFLVFYSFCLAIQSCDVCARDSDARRFELKPGNVAQFLARDVSSSG
jgi:hypothetical protein